MKPLKKNLMKPLDYSKLKNNLNQIRLPNLRPEALDFIQAEFASLSNSKN